MGERLSAKDLSRNFLEFSSIRCLTAQLSAKHLKSFILSNHNWVSTNMFGDVLWPDAPPVTGWLASPCQLELIERWHDTTAARVTPAFLTRAAFLSLELGLDFLLGLEIVSPQNMPAWLSFELSPVRIETKTFAGKIMSNMPKLRQSLTVVTNLVRVKRLSALEWQKHRWSPMVQTIPDNTNVQCDTQ